VRNHLQAGEEVELLLPGESIKIDTGTIIDYKGNQISQAHSGNLIYLPAEQPAPSGALARKRINSAK
jgi:hypothetical protein